MLSETRLGSNGPQVRGNCPCVALYNCTDKSTWSQMLSSHPTNIDNNNGQMSTIRAFQLSGSHDTQDVTNLSLLGPCAAHPWSQSDANDGAYPPFHGMIFSTSSSLSVGFFLPISYLRLNFSDRILWMYLTGSNSARNLRRNECTIQRRHRFYRAYTISKVNL